MRANQNEPFGTGFPRALFYSHDTMGLGHLRRTLLLCEGLRSKFQDLCGLVVTGSAMAHAFRVPQGIDYVKLPSVFKLGNESYQPRSLPVPFGEMLTLRKHLLLATAAQFQPDFLFVDNVPLGMKKEVLPTLEFVRSTLPNTRIFLVLRDILDEKARITSFWRKSGAFEALEKFYDRIFIFGCPELFDLPREYEFPESISGKSHFCGYIPRPVPNGQARLLRRSHCPNGEKLVLVTLGGGSDGAHVVESYLGALPEITRRQEIVSVILLGPDMDRQRSKHLMSLRPPGSKVFFLDFCSEPLTYMEAADCVVSMGGYNTVSEIAWLRKPAIVIPRIFPRSEQLIRSRLLHQNGILEMIHPDRLTSRRLGDLILKKLLSGQGSSSSSLDFTAIEQLASELRPFLDTPTNGRSGVRAL